MSADVLSYLRRLLPAVDPQQPDGELLRRYAATGSEGEFTELLRRHGPLVWAVCRRVLGNAHAAEDVFQATFLQLARRAGTLRRDGSLAGWLHTVATRLAHRALLAEQRRRRRERAHVSSRPPSADDLTWRELRQMLDAEIARLPEAYRQPLILCYLENRPQIEAARRLGLPPAVLRGRLERGRQKLRQRLEKLGLPLAATLLLTKTEPVPAALLEATRQTVCCALAGGPVPSAVAALTTGRSLLSRLKIGALAAVLLITGGVGIDGASRPARPEEKPKDNPGKAAAVRQDLYGDPLPAGVLARLGTARQRAPDSHLAVTADGKEVVAVSSELTVRRFDARTGALRSVRQLPGAGMFSSFRNWLSPRGTLLLVGGVSGPGKYHLSLWDLDKGKIGSGLTVC